MSKTCFAKIKCLKKYWNYLFQGGCNVRGTLSQKKNVTEKPYMRGNAPIYIQCTWYMLGTNAGTRMASQEAVHVFFVFL